MPQQNILQETKMKRQSYPKHLLQYIQLLKLQIMKIQISNLSKLHTLFLVTLFIATCLSASYTYASCNSSYYLNTANLACVTCPNNQIANTYQIVPIACQCSSGYMPSTNGACTAANSSACSITNSYYPIYNRDGSSNSVANCLACSSNSYANKNGTACTPCGPGMTYSATQGCICSSSSNILTDLGCFQTAINPSVTSSQYSKQLKYLIPGCSSFNDYLSCSQIINLCAYSEASTSAPQCQFFNTYSLTSYINPDSSGFVLTPNQGANINFKLLTFSATGNYIEKKKLVLSDLMRCGVPSNAQLGIVFGTAIDTTCEFDFNNLITQMNSKQLQSKTYQLLVQGDNGGYYQVPVYMSGSSTPIRRFFLQDSYTYTDKINVLTTLTLQFSFSGGKLTSPSLTPIYTLLSTQVGTGIAGQSSIKALTYKVQFSSELSGFWVGAIASFIAISIIAVVHAIIKTYIGYLNRKSALLFFLNFAGTYSLWLFYYLLFMSGYWFLFTKITSSPFLLLPTSNGSLYGAFYALVAVMVVFRLVWALIEKSDRLNTQVYLINWQKGQFRNSWRQIFIVNSLAQFYTYRTVSLFWMLVVLLFFMNGVGWQKLSASTTSSSASFYSTLTPRNRILLYFIACSVFLGIGIIFKILRRISVLFWPYPFEDFVDYCTVTNISFIFIKRRAPHAYYLHAALPDRTDVTYKEINDSIRRGLQKNRSIGSQISSIDSLKLYSLYLSKELQQKHTLMLTKTEDQQHSKQLKYNKDSHKKYKVNLREQFVQNRLKPYLEGMASRQNDQRRKSFLQNLCGTPPVDLRQDSSRSRGLVYFDDNMELVNEVFPNGNEFEEIHTMIVIFLGWLTLTNSCAIAAFLTYLVDEYIIGSWVGWSCRNSLQKMTKVKKGFMI